MCESEGVSECVSSDTIKRTPRLTQLVKGSSEVVHRLLAPSSQPQVLLKEPHSLRTRQTSYKPNQQQLASFPGLPPHARNVTRKKIAKLGDLRACGGRPGNEAKQQLHSNQLQTVFCIYIYL